MPGKKPKHRPIEDMDIEELRGEVTHLRLVISRLQADEKNPRVSAVDRNGKSYSKSDMISIFERLYKENPKAIQLMFPSLSMKCIINRARYYGMCRRNEEFNENDDKVIKKYHPDYNRISIDLCRSKDAVRRRAKHIGLQMEVSRGPLWKPCEDDLLRRGLPVPGRDEASRRKRRMRLGINGNWIRMARKLPDGELRKLVEAHVAKGYPDQYRLEAVSDVQEMCLQGRCGTSPEQLAAAGKKAVAAVYKLHPDRGAPVSMDAKLFDDGEATVGDRISSDAFHF